MNHDFNELEVPETDEASVMQSVETTLPAPSDLQGFAQLMDEQMNVITAGTQRVLCPPVRSALRAEKQKGCTSVLWQTPELAVVLRAGTVSSELCGVSDTRRVSTEDPTLPKEKSWSDIRKE